MKPIDAVLEAIEAAREELADLALTLGNTYGPVGAERATAEVVDGWWRAQGIRSRLVEIIDQRANVVAEIGGNGGRTLIFNAHLDTEASGPEYERLMAVPDPNVTGAWREGDRLFGHTILNDRGCMAVFMIAGRALAEHAGPLPGRVVFTSVAGETGQAPVDEYQGLRYEGKGFGSSYLVQHGVVGDFALVAETTDFASCWYNCGAAYFKVTVRGSNMYTPRLVRPVALGDHPNAIVKAAAVVQAIEAWAVDREESLRRQTPCGEVRPKAQVGAIRGGIPWRPNRSSPYCALYVDVRLLPDEPVAPVTESLRGAIAAAGIDAEVDLVMAKAGAVPMASNRSPRPWQPRIARSAASNSRPKRKSLWCRCGATPTCSTGPASRRSRSGRHGGAPTSRDAVTSSSTTSSTPPRCTPSSPCKSSVVSNRERSMEDSDRAQTPPGGDSAMAARRRSGSTGRS